MSHRKRITNARCGLWMFTYLGMCMLTPVSVNVSAGLKMKLDSSEVDAEKEAWFRQAAARGKIRRGKGGFLQQQSGRDLYRAVRHQLAIAAEKLDGVGKPTNTAPGVRIISVIATNKTMQGRKDLSLHPRSW